MSFIRFGVIFGLLGLTLVAYADTLALREDHPQTYIVKKGDTLWDISSYFLRSPWLWPRLWQANPQVDNPHLIYPGDQLNLIYMDGQPQLTRKKMVKLTPKSHLKMKKTPVPTLPLSIINPFLSKDHIVSLEELEDAPIVIGNNKGEMDFKKNGIVYAKGNLDLNRIYGIYHLGQMYTDRETEENLGVNIAYVGVAKVLALNDEKAHTIKIIDGELEIKINDLLLPIPEGHDYPAYFTPTSYSLDSDGYIVDTYSQRSVVGKHDVVLINKGSRDDVKPGYVFGISEPGTIVVHNKKRLGYIQDASVYSKVLDGADEVQLPNERIGELMVFRVYEKMSYALIMHSVDLISPGDSITNL